MTRRLLLIAVIALFWAGPIAAQTPPAPPTQAPPAEPSYPVVTLGVLSYLEYDAELKNRDGFNAFNVTRAGGNTPLFDRIFMGLNVPGAGVVNGTTLTGSEALRRYTNTNQFIANCDVGALANFLNTTSAITGENGGLLRRAGLPGSSAPRARSPTGAPSNRPRA